MMFAILLSLVLTVDNTTWERATVYRLCGGVATRVGEVEPLSKRSFKVTPCNELRFGVRYFATDKRDVSERIDAFDGDRLTLTITPMGLWFLVTQ